ncbi:MAG: hypothetical protein AAFQ42_02020 [Pseudomonadota bacterium]
MPATFREARLVALAIVGAAVVLPSTADAHHTKKKRKVTVNAPHTHVSVDEKVRVNAPYTKVRVGKRRVKVRAPYVNINVGW